MHSSNISYFGGLNIGNFFYGNEHPMKPLRLMMIHDLIISYGMQNFLNFKHAPKISMASLSNFHNSFFVKHILNGKIEFKNSLELKINTFFWNRNCEDCPIFNGVMEYCEKYTGLTLSAAGELGKQNIKAAINWNGGLHHAKPDTASGFCYTNDIVLAILELLRFFYRVLYVDIDIHHGDGVEQAFYLSKRVFTLSFHHYDKFFFPETGTIYSTGLGKGIYFSANIPFKSGLSDESFHFLFESIIFEIIQNFNPSAIVLQSGADSLAGDKLGVFNLSLFGHSSCVDFLKTFNIPLLILGGGGYTISNVVRCWTLETSFLLKKKISFDLPYNNFWEYFENGSSFHIKLTDSIDKNSKKELTKLKRQILCNIKKIKQS